MNLIRRALALTAATAMAALTTLATSACGGATTATSTPTNGLESKSPADALQNAATALAGAKSVHLVGTSPSAHLDVRIQGSSATGTLTMSGAPVKITIIGSDAYINTDQAGLKAIGASPSVQQHDAGRWLKGPVSDLTGFTLADLASQLTAYRTPLAPKVRQATLNSQKVVVVSWQDGGKLYVANTGPAYPLRAELKKGSDAGVLNFTEYGAPLHITAPSNALDITNADPQASHAQAQSDLAALQHDDNLVGGDLRALSSDAHQADRDLAATKGDAALGNDCYNVSTIKIDATNLGQDASIVSLDLSTLTLDIGTVARGVAAMKNDLADLTASGLPATPGATAAIAAAGKATGQAAAKANGEIDQVNADVTQAYSIANSMATGSCAGDGPGRPPVPIGHISSN